MRSILKTLLFVCLVIPTGNSFGALVSFSLIAEPGGTFDLFADVTGGSSGLASYGVPLTGGITSVDHNAPIANFTDINFAFTMFIPAGNVGFSLLRSLDNLTFVTASQDTITPNPLGMVYEIGQVAGNLSTFAPAPTLDFISTSGEQFGGHSATVLLASGTWDGTTIGINTASVDFGANTFNNQANANVSVATVAADVVIIPEPGTLLLGCFSLIGVVVGRRRS